MPNELHFRLNYKWHCLDVQAILSYVWIKLTLDGSLALTLIDGNLLLLPCESARWMELFFFMQQPEFKSAKVDGLRTIIKIQKIKKALSDIYWNGQSFNYSF